MRFAAIDLKHLALALLCGATLLIGASNTAYGQNWHDQRRMERREFRQRERVERRAFRGQLRDERGTFRREERSERFAFRQRYHPGRHYGRGYYFAPGQRRIQSRYHWRSRYYRTQ